MNKKHTTSIVLLLSILCCTLGACGGKGVTDQPDDPPGPPPDQPRDFLPDEIVEALFQVPSANIPQMSEIQLDDTTSAADILDQFGESGDWGRSDIPDDPDKVLQVVIATMLQRAVSLCYRPDHEIPDEGENRPAQNGLAYVFGGTPRDETIRRRPPENNCPEWLYGLDCSGFIHRLATYAGIQFPDPPVHSANQANPASWKSAIPKAWPIKMEKLSGIPSPLKSGDILYWSAGHIGIVDLVNGIPHVWQSNGGPGKCEKNRSNTAGPRRVTYADITSPGWKLGPPTSVLRLQTRPSIAGSWAGSFEITKGPNVGAIGQWSATFRIVGAGPGFDAHGVIDGESMTGNGSVLGEDSVEYGSAVGGDLIIMWDAKFGVSTISGTWTASNGNSGTFSGTRL